jgi:TonB family protein
MSALPVPRSAALALALLGSVALHASLLIALPVGPRVAPTAVTAGPEIEVAVASVEEATPAVSDAPSPPAPVAAPAPTPPHADAPRDRPAIAERPLANAQSQPATKAEAEPMTTAAAHDAVAAVAGHDEAAGPLRFVLGVAPPVSAVGSAAPGVGAAQGSDAAVYAADGVDVPPRLVTWQAPRYPAPAASAGVEVDIPVDVVVDTEGGVVDVRLPKHFGYGLDEAAVAAARSYRFSRGLRGGQPVRVRMRCTVMFRLN